MARRSRAKVGADDQNRTGDLVLTKDALCQLSYIGLRRSHPCRLAATADKSAHSPDSLAIEWLANRSSRADQRERRWSGRRGSNPRPTAWKAVTLPLSYSRLARLAAPAHSALRRAGPPGVNSRNASHSTLPTYARIRFGVRLTTEARSRLTSERRVVAREGLEPSKPLGRQIYSLLRLTASLPRQLSVVWNALLSALTAAESQNDGAGEGI